MINLVRVDNRLIHGQVATNWLKSYDVNICIVVNDEVSTDELQKNLLTMAVSGMMPVRFLSVEDAIKKVANADPKRKIALILRNPIDVYHLVKAGLDIKSVNIGNMHMSNGKEELYKTVYVSNEEKESIKNIISMGIDVEYRLLPGDKKQGFGKFFN